VVAERAAPGALTAEVFSRLEGALATPSFRLAQNAVTQVTAEDVALNRDIVFNTDHSFSHMLDDWSVTNQKQSGRCWMFAGLNLFRFAARKKLDVKEFEFSQNFCMYMDELERSTYFFEAIIESADRSIADRYFSLLVVGPVTGG